MEGMCWHWEIKEWVRDDMMWREREMQNTSRVKKKYRKVKWGVMMLIEWRETGMLKGIWQGCIYGAWRDSCRREFSLYIIHSPVTILPLWVCTWERGVLIENQQWIEVVGELQSSYTPAVPASLEDCRKMLMLMNHISSLRALCLDSHQLLSFPWCSVVTLSDNNDCSNGNAQTHYLPSSASAWTWGDQQWLAGSVGWEAVSMSSVKTRLLLRSQRPSLPICGSEGCGGRGRVRNEPPPHSNTCFAIYLGIICEWSWTALNVNQAVLLFAPGDPQDQFLDMSPSLVMSSDVGEEGRQGWTTSQPDPMTACECVVKGKGEMKSFGKDFQESVCKQEWRKSLGIT